MLQGGPDTQQVRHLQHEQQPSDAFLRELCQRAGREALAAMRAAGRLRRALTHPSAAASQPFDQGAALQELGNRANAAAVAQARAAGVLEGSARCRSRAG